MKVLRYEHEGKIHWGRLEGGFAVPFSPNPFEELRPLPLKEIQLLSPCTPGKILAIGFNYRDHAKELGREIPKEPNVFQKPISALTNPGDPILLPKCMTERVEYEGELVIVMGKKAKHVSREDASQYIFGYTCGNDVSARDLQTPGSQWCICKGFDTFAPIGPWIETEANPFDLPIETRVNGELKQHSNTGNLIFDVPYLVSYLSHVMTLMPGDVIFTGTPFGVSPLKAGDVAEVEIGGIGILKNPVITEA